MNKNLKFFGTDGIRGTYGGKIINNSFAYSLGKAVASHYQKNGHINKPILLARDTRPSGLELMQYLISGINEYGMEVISAGVIPTPVIAYSASTTSCCCAVMITASHNPHGDNGFKIISSEGSKLSIEEEQSIESFFEICNNCNLNFGICDLPSFSSDLVSKYTINLSTKFAKNFLNGIRLVVDLSNGATCSLTPEILRSFGAEVFEINNGNGMINHQCGSEFVQRLQEEVKAQKAHLGFAHDGDGDRVVFVDENGTEVEGDQILGILTIENHHNKSLTGDGLVATIHSNSGLSETLKKNDLSLHRTDVGDRNVYLEMKKLGCNWGGESSGHIICTDYLNTGDGLFAALSVLNCFISSEFENFSKYCEKVKLWPSKSGAVEVMQKTPIENLAGLQDCLQEINKKLGENGRTLVRYSGTEPKLRILVEARNKNLVNEAYAKIYETVSKI